jgi:hypothetical protein
MDIMRQQMSELEQANAKLNEQLHPKSKKAEQKRK